MSIFSFFNKRRLWYWGGFFLLITFIIATSGGCERKTGKVSNRYNLLLIVADTLRSDYLSCYGNEWIKTPSIDSLAADGILFENAFAQASWTLPSHASLMTSKYPIQHGCLSYNNPLSEKDTTLAEILQQNDFKTGAFVSTFLVSSKFGFHRGFDTFDEKLDPDYQRPVTKFHSESLKWIENNKKEPFFLWLHYFEPHYPYLPHSPFTEEYEDFLNKGVKGVFDHSHEWIKEKYNRGDAELSDADTNRLKSLYAGEISYLDGFIGDVIEKLKQDGVYEKTVIVFTSDHGEMLGEHHLIEHGESLYQEEIRVPLIIKLPAGMNYEKGLRVAAMVELVDVLPTVLEYLGIRSDIKFEGKSLNPLVFGKQKKIKDYVYSEVHNFKSIISSEWKLIMSLPVLTQPMLFNISSDPVEASNVYYDKSKTASGMKNRLFAWVIAMNNPLPEKTLLTKDDENKLKSLGYLNAGVSRALNLSIYPPSGLAAEIKGDSAFYYDSDNGKDVKPKKLQNKMVIPLKKGELDKGGAVEFWLKPKWSWNTGEKRKICTVNSGEVPVIIIDTVAEAVDVNDGKVYRGSFLRISVSGEDNNFAYYDISRLSDDIPHHILISWNNGSLAEGKKVFLLVDGIKDDFSPELNFSTSLPSGVNSVIFGERNKKIFFDGIKIYRKFYQPGSIIMQVYRMAVDYADKAHLQGK